MIGQSLGHYQILEKLGSGGMGEVYKARDTRLNRMVAIKVLAPGMTSDPARKRRLIQEAQSASALNHPNIVVIHDINLQDGVDYMVMEYVDGKTLDALIPRQGMRLGEALKVAIPVASGLAAAHGANIIHRDIKPSNIIVAVDGRVKVLDFGLAKLTEEAPGEENDPTRTERARTEEGAVLGTVAYMSPEQAEGKKLDARTDIFSFGALLFEMVTGHRAFAGDSRVSTLSAILKEDPAWPPGVPRDLDQILRRALRKDPARRFQHMDDLRVALEELKEESDSGRLTATKAVTPAPEQSNKWIWPAGAAIVLALGAAGFIWQRTAAGPAAPAPVAEYKLRQLTADSGLTTAPALSPDGKLLAYASDRATQSTLDIWVQPLTEGAQPIRITTDAADDSDPSFSPDGGQLVFWSQREGGGLYLAPVHGGDERLLVRGGRDARFSPDGKSIAYHVGSSNGLVDSRVFIIPASGGVARQVGVDIGWAANPLWSPDGKWLMVAGMAGSNRMETQELWMVPVEGSKSIRTEIRKHLAERKFRFFGHDWRGDALVVTRGSEAWSVAIEPGSWKPGEPRKLVASTGLLRGLQGTPARLVFASANEQYHLWSLPMDPRSAHVRGPLRALPHSGGDQRNPSLSRNGRLVYEQASPGTHEVRIREGLDGKDRVVATGSLRPEISPDGSRVAYSTYPQGGLYLVDPAGGQATEVLDPKEKVAVFDWTPDGQRLLLWHGTPIQFSTIDPRTKQRQVLISHPTLNIHTAALSPDGRWVAFVLTDRGRTLMLAPVRDGRAADEAEWITVLGGPAQQARPWWSPDGNLLYFISDRDRYGCIWALRIHPATGHPVGEPIPVFHAHETRRSTRVGATPFGPALGEDQLVFGMLDQTANIWMAEPRAR